MEIEIVTFVVKGSAKLTVPTIYIIIVFAVIVQSYITSLHPGLSRAKSNGTRRCSAVRRLSSPRSPDVLLGERVLRMLISCPECHRIPLTRSVFMFGTIEDTPNIIRTGCKIPNVTKLSIMVKLITSLSLWIRNLPISLANSSRATYMV